MTVVRMESPGDTAGIRVVNERAFGQSAEADVVDRLRRSCGDYLSFVADDSGIVGHILFTPVTIAHNGGTVTGMGLAPMAVVPERQRQGIGTALVERGLAVLRERGCPFVVVLGHPEYYPRFGFERASLYRISSQWNDVPDEAFMVRVLDPHAMYGVWGIARYRGEFEPIASEEPREDVPVLAESKPREFARKRIETSRLILRAPRIEDAEEIYKRWASDPEVTRYLCWPRHRSLDTTREFLHSSEEEWERWGAGSYVIENKDNGGLIGSCGLHMKAAGRAETGYVLARLAWGRGYATEALKAVLEEAGRAGVSRIFAMCHPDNTASVNVLEKCGFKFSGKLYRFAKFPNLGMQENCDVLNYSAKLDRP